MTKHSSKAASSKHSSKLCGVQQYCCLFRLIFSYTFGHWQEPDLLWASGTRAAQWRNWSGRQDDKRRWLWHVSYHLTLSRYCEERYNTKYVPETCRAGACWSNYFFTEHLALRENCRLSTNISYFIIIDYLIIIAIIINYYVKAQNKR